MGSITTDLLIIRFDWILSGLNHALEWTFWIIIAVSRSFAGRAAAIAAFFLFGAFIKYSDHIQDSQSHNQQYDDIFHFLLTNELKLIRYQLVSC
jgi:hypothetical protein